MQRNELISFIGNALEVDIMPLTHSVLVDKLKEYEAQVLKSNIKSYQVGRFIGETEYDNYARFICDMYGITMERFKSKDRHFQLVMARVHFCRYMRFEHNATVTSMAKYLNRDHTSILHYVKKYKLSHNLPEHSRFRND
jgi:chromosomal replication initiation ATPase DnaA